MKKGFSLLELLVAISLIAILASTGVLSFSAMSISFHHTDAVSQFAQGLRMAQTQTVSEGGRGVLVIASNGLSYSFGYDYLPYDTTDPITYDSQLWLFTMPTKVKVGSNLDIIFNSQGNAIDKDGILVSPTITFYGLETGSPVSYKTGTLNSTGVFSIN